MAGGTGALGRECMEARRYLGADDPMATAAADQNHERPISVLMPRPAQEKVLPS